MAGTVKELVGVGVKESCKMDRPTSGNENKRLSLLLLRPNNMSVPLSLLAVALSLSDAEVRGQLEDTRAARV